MNYLSEILLSFVFINVLLFFEFPKLKITPLDNPMVQKLVLIVAVFVFNYVSQIIQRVVDGTTINNSEIMSICYEKAINSVMGLVMYLDYTSRNVITLPRPELDNPVASIFIVGFDVIVTVFKLLYKSNTVNTIKIDIK